MTAGLVMLSHFIDIQVRADPEFSQPQLLAALYAKLHRQLVRQQSDDIAVSFPGYSDSPRGLGDRLRLLGSQSALEKLMASDWLLGMRDHVGIGQMDTVPAHAVHRRLKRCQFKTSAERLRRRYCKRHQVTAEEALRVLPDEPPPRIQLPYVRLRSSSTGQTFSLFLSLEEPLPAPIEGRFNAYGLSTEASIPWF
ncbi:MAG: type I-F CRISPR-associated endoribonuclease Cas6/Csy4 [Lautropia sp.]|nr:type I-F CRISPR-associated endoribonuclease Cas6/Csy4 [Lautropia sp.]